MKIKKFYEPVFKVYVSFITDCGNDEIKKYLQREKLGVKNFENFDGFTASLEELTEKQADGGLVTYYLLWIRDKKQFYSLLHEVVHLVWKVMDERGVKPDDEIAAYYIEWWFKNLWHFMSKKTVKRNL